MMSIHFSIQFLRDVWLFLKYLQNAFSKLTAYFTSFFSQTHSYFFISRISNSKATIESSLSTYCIRRVVNASEGTGQNTR